MRQTRLPIIYSLFFVTAAHLIALMMLWVSHNTDSTLSFTSASAALPITLLNAAPQSLQKQMLQQAAQTKHSARPTLIPKKITRAVAKPKPSASQPANTEPVISSTASAVAQPLAVLPNHTPTLTSALIGISSTPPRSVQHLDCRIAQPRYPVLSRQREESGITLIKLIVSAYGAIEQATVMQSSGSNRLDYAARAAALASTCRPYRLNGQPLRAAVNLRFKFSLND